MYVAGRSLREDGFVAQFHGTAGGQHRVGNDEGLAVDVRCGEVLHVDAHHVVGSILIFTISADKSIASVVEDVEEAIVERKSGAEDVARTILSVGTLTCAVPSGVVTCLDS